MGVIPDGTIAVVQMSIKPGHAGDDGLLKRSKSGECEGLDATFTVVEGPFAKKKFFSFMILSGTTDGQQQAGDITKSRLRGIIESARGIKPTDVSEAAKAKRILNSLADLDGIRFVAKIGVEPARDQYKEKNILLEAITPDKKEWRPVQQVEQPVSPDVPVATAAASGNGNAIPKPVWAQ
jgi:hypothetical protein